MSNTIIANIDDNTYSSVKSVTIYAGDLTTMRLNATETGDETHRLITDITDCFYTVEGLQAEGTFVYRVKTLYIDGSESAWSNKQEVTLFQNGHGFEPGDVDHSGYVDIGDIALLIDSILAGDDICLICADVNQDGSIGIADVATIIDIVLLQP